MHIAFITPIAPFGSGSASIQSLATALGALGHRVQIGRDWHGLPDEAMVVIDGIVLPTFEPLLGQLVARGAVAFVQHTTALSTVNGPARDEVRAAEHRMLPLMRRVITTSDAVAQRLTEAFGVESDRLRVVTPGVADAPHSKGSGGPGCAILAVGVFTPRKGHDTLLRALARLTDLDWTLTVAGDAQRDPAHAEELEALISELGLARRASLLPNPDAAALDAAWTHADLFASATNWEGHAAAVAEALRRGLPVATTEAAGGLVPQDAGVICKVGDIETMSKAMRRVIFDAELRADMAQAAARAGAALPGWPEQAGKFIQALEA